jgi:hypothetical protein
MNASGVEEHGVSIPPKSQRPSHTRIKRWCKFLALAILVGWGIPDALLPAADGLNPLDLFLAVALAFTCLTWCSADAAEHGKPFGLGWKALVFLLGLGGLTIYVLARRPATTFLKGFGMALVALVCYVAVHMLTHRVSEGA